MIQQTNDSIMLSVSQKYYGKNQTDNNAIISLVGSGLKVDGTSITQYVKSTNTAVEQVKRDKKDTVYHSCYGSSGVNGYLHFAQIKIKSAYLFNKTCISIRKTPRKNLNVTIKQIYYQYLDTKREKLVSFPKAFS